VLIWTAIFRAYKPPRLPVLFVAEQLGFTGDDAHMRVTKFASCVPACPSVLLNGDVSNDWICDAECFPLRREHGVDVVLSDGYLGLRNESS
jgi:hypothetical protein